jgi:DNA-binding CsgD family transcriptional regulator
MEEELLLSSIGNTRNFPALKSHLLHILDTTQLLLNLEKCTLSLTTGDGNSALNVRSTVAPASTANTTHAQAHDPDCDAEEAFQFRQRLEPEPTKFDAAARTARARTPRRSPMDAPAESYSGKAAAPFLELHLVRQTRFGQLTYTERNAVQRVLQSINRTIASHINHPSRDYYARTLERLLAHLRIGFIRLDANLDIVDKSSRVDDLLASTTSYRCESNRLVKIAPRKDDAVKRAIDTLISSRLPYNIVDVVSTLHKGQCAIVVTRLTAGSDIAADDYLVYILCSMADHFEASELLDFWHITPAEKRVLASLTRFGNIKKVALELGISPNTVKSQLKSAYKKLGVDNKISLLRRFSLLRLIDALTHDSARPE